jgi:hypothetical protein
MFVFRLSVCSIGSAGHEMTGWRCLSVTRAIESSLIPPGQREEPAPRILLFLARHIDDPDRARHGRLHGPGTVAQRPGYHDDGRLGGRLIGHGGGYMGNPPISL